jgi:hypothetical protein
MFDIKTQLYNWPNKKRTHEVNHIRHSNDGANDSKIQLYMPELLTQFEPRCGKKKLKKYFVPIISSNLNCIIDLTKSAHMKLIILDIVMMVQMIAKFNYICQSY